MAFWDGPDTGIVGKRKEVSMAGLGISPSSAPQTPEPKEKSQFSKAAYVVGLVLSVVAILYGLSLLVQVMWPELQ